MNKIILIFVFIVVFFIIVSGIVLLLSTYPPKFIIKAFNRNALYNVDKYNFYYGKATAYRMLFTSFSFFERILQVLTVSATFITVYIAVSDSQYVVLASLISATCEIVNLLFQPEKYIVAFSDAALEMEYILHKSGMREDEAYEKFLETYRKAEEIITRTKK